MHLLLTDVVMPRMGGGELSRWIRELDPSVRTLFMTGYTQDPVLQGRAPDPMAQLIRKPFEADGILAKIREILDLPRSAA